MGVNNDLAERGRNPLKVLIADDTAAIRNSISGLISHLPNVELVGAAADGMEALELVRRLQPHYLTLDIRMPKLNGLKVLEAIQREGLAVKVIVLTGLMEPEYRRKCMELGAVHFFQKNMEFEAVMEILSHEAKLRDPFSTGEISTVAIK